MSMHVVQNKRIVNVVRRVNPSYFVMAMTRTQAYKRVDKAEKAVMKELTQIYDRGTLRILDKRFMMTLPQLRKLYDQL